MVLGSQAQTPGMAYSNELGDSTEVHAAELTVVD